MNMFLHNINYDKFNISAWQYFAQAHILVMTNHFDAIVSNPRLIRSIGLAVRRPYA